MEAGIALDTCQVQGDNGNLLHVCFLQGTTDEADIVRRTASATGLAHDDGCLVQVKFSPAGNKHLVELLESEGAEAVVPDLIDFMLYCFYNQIYKAEHLGTSKKTAKISALGIWAIEHILRGSAVKAFEESKHFDPPTSIYKIVSYAEPIVSIGNQTGEGWFLTGEMVELIKEGVPNIVCTQPFGCLPNHVVGKGVIKALRKAYPSSNIVAIDYDPGASEVNQLNRIKLMLSTAQKNLKKGEGSAE